MVQPDLLAGFGETGLDRPAHAAHPDQRGQRGVGGGVTGVVLVHGCLRRVGRDAATHQQPGLRPRQAAAHRHPAHRDEVGHERPFAPFQHPIAPPARGGHPRRPGVGALLRRAVGPQAGALRGGAFLARRLRRHPGLRGGLRGLPVGCGQAPALGGAGEFGQVVQPGGRPAVQERRTVAIPLVADHPARPQRPGLHRRRDQRARQRVLGLEGGATRDAAGSPARGVRFGEPTGGQVEPAVQQGVTGGAGVAQVDPRLAIIALPRVPTGCPLGAVAPPRPRASPAWAHRSRR